MPTRTDSIPPELQHLSVPINSVDLWGGNPRRGDVGAISESLKKHGQIKPIIVQKSTMRVVAGNHVLRAAAALGWTEIAALVIELDDKKAKSYVAADNRASELGDFDEELLAKLLADIAKNDTLEGTGYDQDDLDDLLSKVGTGGRGYGQGDPDKVGMMSAEPWVKPGQVFQMSYHRIACGVGDDMEVIGRLLEGETPSLLVMRVPADDGAYGEMLAQFDAVKEQLWFDPWETDLMDQLITGGTGPDSGSLLVWDKQAENTSQEHTSGFSLIWSRQKHKQEIFRHTLVGAADGEKAGGPDWTERPTKLFEDLFERYSKFEGIILDPYAIANSALLAADRTGRRWYGAKSDPAYVQATLERWKEYSGLDWEEVTD